MSSAQPTELSSLWTETHVSAPILRLAEHGTAWKPAPAGAQRARTQGRAKERAYDGIRAAAQVKLCSSRRDRLRYFEDRPCAWRRGHTLCRNRGSAVNFFRR